LADEFEIDETYAGGIERGVIGRQTKTKAAVMIAAEAAGAEIGRIQMSKVPDVSAHSLERFVQKWISVGSVVYTNDWRGYSGLQEARLPTPVHRISQPAGI
jgi:hypothetical protein